MLLVYIILLNIALIVGSPLPDDNRPSSLSNQVDLFKFFRDFGYLKSPPSDSETLYTEDAVSTALKQVQKFGGIPETGKFDSDTQKLISTPRCGNPDIISPEESQESVQRRKRYIIGSEGWRSKRLTYNLRNVSPKFPRKEIVEESLRKAFDAWSRYSGLTFHQVEESSLADISISFGSFTHGDKYPFDGPGYTLAHAYYPYTYGHLGGDIHFDEDENWGLGPKNLDLFTVAIHEIGHSLGLSHSTDQESVMFAYYKGDTPALGYDDILAVYDLYIQNSPLDEEETNSRSRTTSTTIASASTTMSDLTTIRPRTSNVDTNDRTIDGSENPVNAICYGSFDSIAVIRGEIFVFKGQSVWRYRRPGDLVEGFPLPTLRMFPGIPSQINRIDAAYERLDGNIVFVSGERLHVYDGLHWRESSHLSRLELPEDLRSIDSVAIWGKNQRTYVFKDKHFWRLDDEERVEKDYPRLIRDFWTEGPSTVDSIIVWNQDTYAFSKGLVWKFHDETMQVESGYPLEISFSDWFPHCKSS